MRGPKGSCLPPTIQLAIGADMCSLESCRTPHQEYRNVGESGTCRGRGCECVGGWCAYIYVYIYVYIYIYIYIYI